MKKIKENYEFSTKICSSKNTTNTELDRFNKRIEEILW
jgi:hypothetical protein